MHLEWLPYILDIPGYLGSARIDADGKVVEATRNAHQWRRVRYSYMDCRRQANKRGLVIRGTQKIWRFIARRRRHAVHAKCSGTEVFRRYNDRVFERFWKRELDIEDVAIIAAVLTEAGANGAAFPSHAQACRDEVAAISRAAEQPAYSASQPSSWMASCSGVASIFRKFVRCSQPDDRPA